MQRFTGKQYLKIDIASNFGLDKKTWDERLAWFHAHESRLDEMLGKAKEPALYFAGVQAYRAACKGQPSGYPISLDATSSGLQLLACLTGDRKAASLCNVINRCDDFGQPMRMDAYTAIYEAMLSMIGESGKISRDKAKDAVMTALYGSKAVPKKVFGEGNLLTCFYDTMEREAPAAWKLNEFMPQLWQDTTCHSWIMPDNFHVHIKVMTQAKETVHFLNEPFDVYHWVNEPTEQGRSLGANTIHSLDGMIVREMTRRCDYDPARVQLVRNMFAGQVWMQDTDEGETEAANMVITLWDHYKRTGYLSARIIDYINSDLLTLLDINVIADLLDSLPVRPFKIISIHDCFRVLPNYGNDLREQYNLQLQLIAKSRILDSFVSQITGREVQLGTMDPHLWKEIADSEYALS